MDQITFAQTEGIFLIQDYPEAIYTTNGTLETCNNGVYNGLVTSYTPINGSSSFTTLLYNQIYDKNISGTPTVTNFNLIQGVLATAHANARIDIIKGAAGINIPGTVAIDFLNGTSNIQTNSTQINAGESAVVFATTREFGATPATNWLDRLHSLVQFNITSSGTVDIMPFYLAVQDASNFSITNYADSISSYQMISGSYSGEIPYTKLTGNIYPNCTYSLMDSRTGYCYNINEFPTAAQLNYNFYDGNYDIPYSLNLNGCSKVVIPFDLDSNMLLSKLDNGSWTANYSSYNPITGIRGYELDVSGHNTLNLMLPSGQHGHFTMDTF